MRRKGKRIGDFQMGKVIGEGTFGKVYKGFHLPTSQDVAVKVLEKQKIKEEGDLNRIQSQLSILQRVDHPNLLTLLQLHESPKALHLVTELIEGTELYHLIIKYNKLSEQEAKFYFYQLVEGITYLHNNNICHRDIKPENILITSDGQIKLIDFGLSKEFGEDRMLRTSCGSPCYAAPEMLSSDCYDGNKVDVWALGVTLYAMLAGKLPFQHQQTTRLYDLVQEGKYEPIPQISSDLSCLLSKMLKTDPGVRMDSYQIKHHPWLKSLLYYPEPIIVNDQILIHSMSQLFGYEQKRLRKIIKTRQIPSIFSYYYLMKKYKLNPKHIPKHQQPSSFSGPYHLQFMFNSLESVKRYLNQHMPGCKFLNQFTIQYKDTSITLHKIKNTHLLYLDIPIYHKNNTLH